MIPVAPQPEPTDFDEKVRQPGLAWLNEKGIALNGPPPDASKLPTHWRNTQRQLWDAYQGICAYLCIYFDWPLGAHSTEHFIAKSSNAGQAYEWLNYRLSCLGMNRNKNKFDDVLDPFEIQPDTFILNLASGEMKPNPNLHPDVAARAVSAIKRLKLNNPETKKMRAGHYEDYCRGDVTAGYFERKSPFVWYEARRQGLL